MPRWVRVIAWIAVFTACAGIGAFIASRSNPFPPGVEDPGARSTESPTPPPTPTGTPFTATGVARTSHELFVGGTCDTDWVIGLTFTVDDANRITGSGVATLQGRLRCDFPTAQTQARVIDLTVGGHVLEDRIDPRLEVAELRPVGSDDFGGLLKTLPRFPSIPLTPGSVSSTVQVPDGDLGSFDATYRVKIVSGG